MAKTSHKITELEDNKKVFNRRYLFLIIVIGIVILIFFVFRNNGQKTPKGTVFVINGKNYSSKDVNSIISYPLDSKQGTRDYLSHKVYNYLIRQQEAQKLNIVPSETDIQRAKTTEFGFQLDNKQTSSEWVKLVSYDYALQQNIETNNVSSYEGFSLIFWFAQHLETGPAFRVADFGNQKLVKQDQAYASSRANYYYGQLKSKSMTADEVLRSVQNDNRLSFVADVNKYMSYSTHFGLDNNKTWQIQAWYPDVINYVSSQSSPGLSSIRTGKVNVVNVPKSSKDYANGYYYIVQLDKAKKISNITTNDFSKDTSTIKAKYIGW